MNRILVDTNILVYAIDQDSRFHNKSQQLLFNSNYDLHTTSKNISEFLSVVTGNKAVSLPINDALVVVKDFADIFRILYPTETSFSIFRELLQRYKPYGLKIHDFEIISIGLASELNQIATYNAKDFTNITEINLVDI